RADSWRVPYQAYENVLQRALAGSKVLELDAMLVQPPQKFGDARALALGVEGVCQLQAIAGQRQRISGQVRGYAGKRSLQLERQLLLAKFLHQRDLVLDEDDLPTIDDPDAIGHFLGLLDIVGRQNDGDSIVAQATHH